MSLITCKAISREMDERAPMIEAWLAGYFSATQDRSTIDLRYLERNIKVARQILRKPSVRNADESDRENRQVVSSLQPFAAFVPRRVG